MVKLTFAEDQKVAAQKYCDSLAGQPNPKMTFQTFVDNKDRKKTSLTRILHGTLSEHWDLLVSLNEQGAGIFATVNETNLISRKKDDVTRIRGIFQEDDEGAGWNHPLIEPNMVIKTSPGKKHRYIFTDSDKLEEFDAVQLYLVQNHGSDPSAKDISRVLRVPGFYHLKNPVKPYLVKIEGEIISGRNEWEDLKKYFPPIIKEISTSTTLPKNKNLANFGKLYSALCYIDPDESYQQWIEVGMALHHASSGSVEGLFIWDKWSQSQGSVKYVPYECLEKWGTFRR